MCVEAPSGPLQSLLADHRAQLQQITQHGYDLEEAHRLFKIQQDIMRQDLGNLREECEALRDCLHYSRVLTKGQLQSRRSARRATGVFRVMLQASELALALGTATGVSTARRLCEVSKAHGSNMRTVMPTLCRKLPPEVFVFGGKNDSSVALATAECFSVGSGKWRPLPPMPTARYGCASAALDGLLYVVGGHDGKKVLPVAERFHPATSRWECLPPMPTARSRCAAASVRGMLYVIGGRDSRQRVTSAECFDPSVGQWQWLPPMPLAPLGCAAAALKGKLYVVGVDDQREMAVESFDPYAFQWHGLPPQPRTPKQRFGCAAATVSSALHVVGGHDGQQPVATMERFSISSGLWETLPQLPTPRHGCAATAIAGVLYVVGGDDTRSLTAAERYDPKLKRWETMPPLPTGRFGCAAASAWL